MSEPGQQSDQDKPARKPRPAASLANLSKANGDRHELTSPRIDRAAELLALGHRPHEVRAVLKIECGVNWRTADRYISAAKERIQASDNVPKENRRFELAGKLRSILDTAERDCDKIRAIETLIDLYGVSLGSKQQATGESNQTLNLHVHYEIATTADKANESTAAVGVSHARLPIVIDAESRPAV